MTGGGAFLGGHVATYFTLHGMAVIALFNSKLEETVAQIAKRDIQKKELRAQIAPEQQKYLTEFDGDVTNRDDMERLFSEHKPNALVHAAALLVAPVLREKRKDENDAQYRVVLESHEAEKSRFIEVNEAKVLADCIAGYQKINANFYVCKPSLHRTPQDTSQAIESWVNARVVKIESSKIPILSEGIAILDGKQRSKLFSDFMRRRALPNQPDAGIAEKLQALILSQMAAVINDNKIRSIVVVPSTTWQSREAVGRRLLNQLKIPVFLELLDWLEKPVSRQGELLNNDQRRLNVTNKMIIKAQSLPTGSILLVDDYVGSGATIKEVARALRKKVGASTVIVPFAIAAVKWKLGQRGMI